MTTPTDMPAQWALDEALRRVNGVSPNGFTGSAWTASEIIEGAADLRYAATVTELARMIEKHEQPPVDPDVLAVREVVAKWSNLLATDILAGFFDDTPKFQAALAAFRRHKGGE